MNAELKAKWLAALRSGDYQQGREYLHRGDTFCCLGVLCEVALIPREPCANDGEVWAYLFEDSLTGVSVVHGAVRDALDGQAFTLTAMNDTGEKSFKQIANWIETHIPAE